MTDIPRLKVKPRPGYARSADTIELILEAALELWIQEGYRALTLRRIASACGLTVGNLTYHFPNKEALIQELLEAVLYAYQTSYDETRNDPTLSAEEKLTTAVRMTLEDIQSQKTTRLFLELWALSNHDPFIAEQVDRFYAKSRHTLGLLVAELNPRLSPEECAAVALFMSCAIEGSTPFAGYRKPFGPAMPRLAAVTVKALIQLAKTIEPEEVHAFEADWAFLPSAGADYASANRE